MLPCSIYQNILSCAISYKNWYIWISNYIFLRRLTSLGRKQTILLLLSCLTTVYSTPMMTQSPGISSFLSYVFISYHISLYLIISHYISDHRLFYTHDDSESRHVTIRIISLHILSYLNISHYISDQRLFYTVDDSESRHFIILIISLHISTYLIISQHVSTYLIISHCTMR